LITIFVIAGLATLIYTRASTATASLEAENGTLTKVSRIDTSLASNKQAIKFSLDTTGTGGTINSTTPCGSKPAPQSWHHVVVLLFENKTYNEVIGSSSSPYITDLASKCGTYTAWKDANIRADGSVDGSYPSKPNYATLTSGVPPSVHGITSDSYSTTSDVDNIFNRLNLSGKTAKSYQSGTTGSCAKSNFSGAYHDPLRFYTNLGGQSSSPTTYCNTHDAAIADFMTDVNSGQLPAYSFILPTNTQNTHDNSIASGDAWAQDFLTPLFDSAQYKSGDTAVFFLWDEDTPIPNVLIAPSVIPGSKPTLAAGSNPIGHYSALRTWQEMLGVTPLLGSTGQAPSLLNFYNGKL
jgi:phospholipase C